MMDLRFATALRIMQYLVLAERQGIGLVSSSQFAEGLRANPTLIRRLMSTMVQRGLLASQMGRNGGMRLARPAEEITLAEIYEVAMAGKTLWEQRTDLPHRCVVSGNFERYFRTLIDAADQSILDLLGRQTLADSFAALEKMESARALACARAGTLSALKPKLVATAKAAV